jgi:hypothetical protein
MNYLAISRLLFFMKIFSENEKEFPFSFPFWGHNRFQPNSPKSTDAPSSLPTSPLLLHKPQPSHPADSLQPARPARGPSKPDLRPEAEATTALPPSLLGVRAQDFSASVPI